MPSEVLGIIAPHPPIMVEAVGSTRSAVTAASASALRSAAVLLNEFAPDTLVVMSPHSPGYREAFTVSTDVRRAGSLAQFGAPQHRRDTPGDPDLASAIIDEAVDEGIACDDRHALDSWQGSGLDHGVLVPLAFLDPEGRYPTLDMAFSLLPASAHAAFGRVIRRAAARLGRRIAFVASGDLSHRLTPDAPAGYSPRGHEFDELVVACIGAGDFESLAAIDPVLLEDAGECGWRSFVTLGGYLDHTGADARVLAYEAPWGVGYLTAVFAAPDDLAMLGSERSVAADFSEFEITPAAGIKGGMKGDDEPQIVRLARTTVEQYVRSGTVPVPTPFDDPALPRRAGVFVSLHAHGDLRGCIGTIAPSYPSLAEEVVHNAVQASTADPRFPPVGESELDALDISVDVLHAPEPVSGLDELDAAIYGVIVSSGGRRGLLLPDLDGVDTPEEQIAIARRKAGIGAREPVRIERFRVDRHA